MRPVGGRHPPRGPHYLGVATSPPPLSGRRLLASAASQIAYLEGANGQKRSETRLGLARKQAHESRTLTFLVPVGAALAAIGVAGKPAPTRHESLLKCRSRATPTRKSGHSIPRRVEGILRQPLITGTLIAMTPREGPPGNVRIPPPAIHPLDGRLVDGSFIQRIETVFMLTNSLMP